jgi:hypothetical protein
VDGTVNVDLAFRRTAFFCVSGLASQFSVHAGERDQFLFLLIQLE